MSADDNNHGNTSNAHAEDVEFAEELERRLETIEADDYEDPARKDLPPVELLIFTVVSIAVIVLVHLWGF